ncbi:MAG: bifunctional nicotinamidase/pyrazinamidase [Gammaproteobacteria bacterium]|nr:bifunctional nicotinamidase/pyrazinamidase [Gammaproteobacteria bacterium]
MATEPHNPATSREKTALLLVDVQPDFLPGGALPVQEQGHLLQQVRELMVSERLGLQVTTQDWHPPGHVSFASSHEGRRPFETIELYGHDQTLWPDHCVQGSSGAELHPELPWERVAAIVRKGSDPAVDSYSGFRNNWGPDGERPSTGLAGYLRERGVTDLYLCGLARDICVKWTAEDAVEAGFRVYFVWDATRPVDPASDEQVRADLERQGVSILTLEQLAA